jgi:hypothetical protein
MEYDTYTYLYPPRPTNAVTPTMLGFYERQKWLAQVKKNGTCTVIFARGMQVKFMTRHNDEHKQWSPLPEHLRPFQSSNLSWNVWVAELIHNKTKNVKQQLYVFDIIVKDGVQLVGTTFEERQRLLHASFPGVNEGDKTRVNENVTIANCFTSGFKKLYDTVILNEEDEGIVLKRGDAQLVPCFKSGSNGNGMVKCRRPTKNYGF